MKKIEWVKLDTGFFEDEKVILLMSQWGEKIILFFLRLLTMAGKQNQDGQISLSENIPYSVTDLAKICKISSKKCEEFLIILEDFGIISTELLHISTESRRNSVEILQNHEEKSQYKQINKAIFITNWAIHQSSGKLEIIRQQQAERAKRYRENQNKSHVTVTLRNALEVRREKGEVRSKNKEIKESVTIDENCNVTDNRCSAFSNLEVPNNSEIHDIQEPIEKATDTASLEGEKVQDNRKQGKPLSKKEQEKAEQKKIALDVLKFLNEMTGKKYRLTQPFQGMLNARIADGYSMEEMKTVVRKKTMEWKGTEWEKYLAPDTLFGPKKFDKYLNQPWPKETRQPPKGGISSWGVEEDNYEPNTKTN